jgi:hypothetical protein
MGTKFLQTGILRGWSVQPAGEDAQGISLLHRRNGVPAAQVHLSRATGAVEPPRHLPHQFRLTDAAHPVQRPNYRRTRADNALLRRGGSEDLVHQLLAFNKMGGEGQGGAHGLGLALYCRRSLLAASQSPGIWIWDEGSAIDLPLSWP